MNRAPPRDRLPALCWKARAFSAFGERLTEPSEIVPAIKRGIAATERGEPALLEFITAKEVAVSKFK